MGRQTFLRKRLHRKTGWIGTAEWMGTKHKKVWDLNFSKKIYQPFCFSGWWQPDRACQHHAEDRVDKSLNVRVKGAKIILQIGDTPNPTPATTVGNGLAMPVGIV